MLDLLRFVIGLAILIFASYSDFKQRIARNELWIIMAIVGIILLPFSEYNGIHVITSILITLPIAFSLLFFGMGGADAKALIALSFLAPLFPSISIFPLWKAPVLLPFPLIIFINSLLLFLAIPISLFFYNIIHKNTEFPYCFFGYKMNAEKAKAKEAFVWSMEKVVDGKQKKTIFPQKDVDFSRFGNEKIWVTPRVPFLIPLTIGYILSFFLGDILYKIISLFL